MKQYLSLGILGLTALIAIYFYYIGFPIHGEVKEAYFYLYLFIVSIIYGTYKVLQSLGAYGKVEIKPSTLLYGFLTHYLLICIYLFVVTGNNISLGLVLFFKSLVFILGAGVIWLSFYCFGQRLLSIHASTEIDDPNVQKLVSLGIGFTATMLLIFIAASLGAYNIYSILIIFGGIIGVSFNTWKTLFAGYIQFSKTYIKRPQELLGNTSLLIDEMLFLFITFLLSVSFVSVFRPFPIGWDDLGAYMNYPKLLAGAGEHVALGKMYLWEMYTGIGFLAGSQTFAFYLNSFAGVIAVIVIYLAINTFTKFTQQKYNLGLLAGTMFLMMPMVVFQTAKDMKIDIGLFSISVIALSLLYYLLFSIKKHSNILYILLGIIIGTAFAMKVTSLLLLLGAISAIFYSRYKVLGFLSFLGLFIGTFSIAGLWEMVNVVIPGDGALLTYIGLGSLFVGGGILGYLMATDKKHSRDISAKVFFIQVSSIILGFIIALLPWGVKHVGEIPKGYDTSISTFISGVSDRYIADYDAIYSSQELKNIRSEINSGISASGITSNEDFGRYFGYEEGINNFLKLPWNLSLQLNQGGEFTDITFLFLALLPGVFLFLPYRREHYRLPVVLSIILLLVYFIPSPISFLITQLFSHINLPLGYIVIIGFFLAPLIYFTWALDKKQKATQFFLINLAFVTLYMGLWAISSYGIVWYGIVMYFVLIALICICIISTQEDEQTHSYLSYTILGLVVIYSLQSSIPHGITNLKNASYTEYKIGTFNEEVSLMKYHPEYFPIMLELNISDEARSEIFIEYRKELLMAISGIGDFEQVLPQIQSYSNINELHRLIIELTNINFPEIGVNQKIQQIQQDLYEVVIYSPEEYKNTKNIYRVGTFLKYFISENNSRMLEDSLIKTFENYIYDEDNTVVYDRLEAIDIDYILLDLNAATIDQDPAKNLTVRYDHLLRYVTDSRVELIETDSICLRVALDNYKADNNPEVYMAIAGVNYSSNITQAQKRQTCFSAIQKIISVDENLQAYPYLVPYKNALMGAGIDVNNVEIAMTGLSQIIRGNGHKALFKIN